MQKQPEKPTKNAGKSKKKFLLGPVTIKYGVEKTGSWRIERPEIDRDVCLKCGTCSSYCPVAAIEVNKVEDYIEIDFDYCKGCGICATVCPVSCINMVKERGADGE